MSNAKAVQCIYCKLVRKGSKEHVVQASLGGNLTTPLVCEGCNTGFSKIDKSLAENSLLALTRVGVTGPGSMSVRLGGDQFWQDASGLWNDVKIVNGLRPLLLPQIHLVSLGEQAQVGITGGDHAGLEAFLELVDSKVADGSFLSVYVKVGPPDKCSNARLVGYRSDALYVRAISEEAGRTLLNILNSKWKDLRTQQKSAPPQPMQSAEKPSVQIQMSICLDDNYRAVAKIAFNFLAQSMGADFVLRDEFDPIRDYIRGIGLVHKDPLPEGEVAVDARYVRALLSEEKPLVPTGSHAIVVTYDAPFLYGLVTLYEKNSFVVRLAEIHLSEQLLFAHEFSIDRSANKPLEMAELARRLWESSRG